MKPRLVTLVALLAAAAAGCALGPDYERPDAGAPAAYRGQSPVAGEGSLGELGWWQVYRDPTLQALIRSALEQNLDVRIAAARVEQAQAALGSTRLQLLPNLSARGSAEREQLSSDQVMPDAPRLGSQHSVSANLSYEIDLWGRLRRASEAARAELLASEYARRAVMVGLVGDVATAYFNLVTFDKQLKITQRTVETRAEFLRLTRAQFERGVVSGLDVSTAEAQLATARTNIPDLERRIAQTEDLLSTLLGRNPDAVARGAAGGAPLAPDTPEGLPASLLQRRPDLREAEQSLVAANARVGAAKAALFPTISLTGAFGSLSSELSRLFSAPMQTWSAGVGLVQPLLDADRNLYQLDLADARKREAILQYQKAVQSAFREVADALVARTRFREAEAAQTALVDAQERANEIALARYKVGYSSYFDVINADRDLFNAKLTLSSARLNSLLATVQLYAALGGGWQMEGEAAGGITVPASPVRAP